MRCAGHQIKIRLTTFLLLACIGVACKTERTDKANTSLRTASPFSTVNSNSVPLDVLRVGDRVVVVSDHEGDSEKDYRQRINERGEIVLWFGERFSAAGRTTEELRQEILSRCIPKHFAQLDVRVQQPDSGYYVGGALKSPCSIVRLHLPDSTLKAPPVTVLKAIDNAGPFSEFADWRRIKLWRADGTTTIVDGIKARKYPKLDLPLREGDFVYVPIRTIR